MIGLFVPAEALYRRAVILRNHCYDLGFLPETESGIPIISVGNLTVGGTGKTPVASWLIDRLTTMGHRPALVTRVTARSPALRASESRRAGSGPEVEAVAQAMREGAESRPFLDDGFQHRAAKRNVDIVLLAAEQGAEGPLLPRGRFREPLSALSRADAIVITRKVATQDEACTLGRLAMGKAPNAAMGQIHLREDVWTELKGEPPADAYGGLPAGDLLAVSSIAEPDGFHDGSLQSRWSGRVHGLSGSPPIFQPRRSPHRGAGGGETGCHHREGRRKAKDVFAGTAKDVRSAPSGGVGLRTGRRHGTHWAGPG